MARGTFQVPVAKFAMFTPKLSSVTVAENKNDRRLGSLAHIGAKDAEYSIWRVFTSDTLAMMEARGLPASHMLGIMN